MLNQVSVQLVNVLTLKRFNKVRSVENKNWEIVVSHNPNFSVVKLI